MGDKHGYMTSLDQYEAVMKVYDAAMAARKGGAFYMAITLLREHGLHDYAELFVPLEMACLRRAYEKGNQFTCRCCNRMGQEARPTADSLEWECDCSCHPLPEEVEHE